MLTGMFVLTPSIADAKSSMDSNLKLLWMNTDVAPLHTSARQGFGMNGKFYLQNKDTKQIEVWDETGKIRKTYRLHASKDHSEEMAFAYEIHCPKCGNYLKQIGRQLTFNTLGLYKCPVCDRKKGGKELW